MAGNKSKSADSVSTVDLISIVLIVLCSLQFDQVNAKLALVIKSGKVTLGAKSTRKTLRSGKAKLLILAGNTPPLLKSELLYYAMLSNTPIHHFAGDNVSNENT